MNQKSIAIIGGGLLSNLSALKGLKVKKISTPHGNAFYYLAGDCPLILRHGTAKNVPPHKINYKANIFALKKLKRKCILAFNSTGSLKKHIKPGEFLVVDDYIGFDTATFYNKQCKFITPQISPASRQILINTLKKLKFSFKSKGIYFETRGPRLETKAEIALLKDYADVVGMTMAKEATLSQELGLDYASLCSVDNYANGITTTPLTEKEIFQGQAKMKDKIEKIITKLLQ